VGHDRPGARPDRLIVAELTGAAQRHANWHQPDDAETAEAVAELLEILASRDDGAALLAEVAGLLLGFHGGGPGEPKARTAASFCVKAGADQSLIPQWTAEGRRRATAARLPRSASQAVHHHAGKRVFAGVQHPPRGRVAWSWPSLSSGAAVRPVAQQAAPPARSRDVQHCLKVSPHTVPRLTDLSAALITRD
jgi:hypothetical protein